MLVGLDGYSTSDDILTLQRVYYLFVSITYFILLWDWLSNLSNEWKLVARSTFMTRRFSLNDAFLFSRYLTLAWCTFLVITAALVDKFPSICAWFKYYTYGYSAVMLSAHLIMVLRIHTIYDRKPAILWTLLGLAVIDFAAQMAANHLASSVYLESSVPQIRVCFIMPTSQLYAIVFVSPTLFHHILLAMTLFRSVRHLRITNAVGIGSIMRTIQRDHILYTLAICLINFANLVLVLQHSGWPYKLVNQLPAAAFTQIFLSRIVFSLKQKQIKLSSASQSPMFDTTIASTPRTLRFADPLHTREKSDQTLAGSPTLYKVFSLARDAGRKRSQSTHEHHVELRDMDLKGEKQSALQLGPLSPVPYSPTKPVRPTGLGISMKRTEIDYDEDVLAMRPARVRMESERTLLPLSPLSPLPGTPAAGTGASSHEAYPLQSGTDRQRPAGPAPPASYTSIFGEYQRDTSERYSQYGNGH